MGERLRSGSGRHCAVGVRLAVAIAFAALRCLGVLVDPLPTVVADLAALYLGAVGRLDVQSAPQAGSSLAA